MYDDNTLGDIFWSSSLFLFSSGVVGDAAWTIMRDSRPCSGSRSGSVSTSVSCRRPGSASGVGVERCDEFEGGVSSMGRGRKVGVSMRKC